MFIIVQWPENKNRYIFVTIEWENRNGTETLTLKVPRCVCAQCRSKSLLESTHFSYFFLFLYVELKEPVGQIVCTDKGILAVEQNKVLVPPTWSKTFAWGYADLSCRLANYESDKVSNNYCNRDLNLSPASLISRLQPLFCCMWRCSVTCHV